MHKTSQVTAGLLVAAHIGFATLLSMPASAHPVAQEPIETVALFDASALETPENIAEEDVVLQDIEFRPGVSGDIHVRVYDNPHMSCKSNAVLAIHGASGAASVWGPMAHAVFSGDHGRSHACKFIAMDLPGHGKSSLPRGAMYGELSLDDYASAVIGTLEHLDGDGIHVREIMSHSMGGLVTQMVQQRLVDEGSNLREAFGVKRAVMLAPAMPKALPSAFTSDPLFGALLGAFASFDPVLGDVLYIPDALFPALVFSRPDHTIASNAPTPEEITAQGYNNPESLAAMSQLAGILPTERPDVDPGIFSDSLGTKLDLVTFENDSIVLPEEGSALYTYLTGDEDLSRFTLVEGDDAVHGLPISDPAAMPDTME